jgi:hypothetical protein
MKKEGVLLLVFVFAICLSLTACGKTGGTFEFINDRDFSIDLTLDIDNKEIFVGILSQGEKKSYSSSDDFNWSYSVKKSGSSTLFPSTGYGNITNGDTTKIWASGIFK